MWPLRAALVALSLALLAATGIAQTAPPTGGVEVEELGDPTPPAEDPFRSLEAEAESAYGDGDLDRAITLYRQAIDQAPQAVDQARVLVTVAWLELLQAQPEATALDLERALYLAPDLRLRDELYNEEFSASSSMRSPGPWRRGPRTPRSGLAPRSRRSPAAISARRGLSSGSRWRCNRTSLARSTTSRWSTCAMVRSRRRSPASNA